MANDQVEAVGAGAADGTDASVVADDTKADKVGDAGMTIERRFCSHSPSQNIPQSSRK